MHYTLFLYGNEAAMANMPAAAAHQVQGAFRGYTQALQEAGILVASDWLKPSSTATTLTLRDGGRRVQDGPYADTKEQLGGFYMINVPDLDTALLWAERCPAAHHGVIEVRPSNAG
jgi:hypothetical protein